MGEATSTVVVGIGNDYRGDDGVGLHVARLVGGMAREDLKVVEGIADGYSLLETWTESSSVFIIDCAVSGATPGRTYRFDALRETIPGDLFDGRSTHAISLVEAIGLARTLGRLPRRLVVFGIEGADFSSGLGLSPEVKRAARATADGIVDELQKTRMTG